MEGEVLSSLDPESYERVYVCRICNGISKEAGCKQDHMLTIDKNSNNLAHIDFENYIKPSILSTPELELFRKDKERDHQMLENTIFLQVPINQDINVKRNTIQPVKSFYMCPTCGQSSTEESCRNDHSISVPNDVCKLCGITFDSIVQLMEHTKGHECQTSNLESLTLLSPTETIMFTPELFSSQHINVQEPLRQESAAASLPENFAVLVQRGTIGLGQYQVMTSSSGFIYPWTNNDTQDVFEWDDAIELAVLDSESNFDEMSTIDEINSSSMANLLQNSSRPPVLNEPSNCNIANTISTVAINSAKTQPQEHRRFPRCMACDLDFSDIDSLMVHCDSHGNSFEYNCQFCPRRYSRPYWFQAHLKTHVDHLPLICPFCDDSFLAAKDHEEHVRIVHNLSSSEFNKLMQSFNDIQKAGIMCMECGRFLKSEKHFDLHMKIHEMAKERNVVTNTVDNSTESISCTTSDTVPELVGAVAKNKNIPRKPIHIFECNICSATIKSIEEVRLHLSNHAQNRLYKCEACSERFPTATHLQKHICANLTKKESAEHKCESCKKVFSHAAGLACHLRTHFTDQSKEFHCDKCSLKFKMLSAYLIHRAKNH